MSQFKDIRLAPEGLMTLSFEPPEPFRFEYLSVDPELAASLELMDFQIGCYSMLSINRKGMISLAALSKARFELSKLVEDKVIERPFPICGKPGTRILIKIRNASNETVLVEGSLH